MGPAARLYSRIALLVGLLLLPAGRPAPQPVGLAADASLPFLSAVRAQVLASRALTAVTSTVVFQPQPIMPVSAGRAPLENTAPTQVKSVASSTTVAVVREGQALWDIARTHGVSVEALTRANGLRSADLIRAGQRLKIPGAAAAPKKPAASAAARNSRIQAAGRPATVVVQQGQTLSEIAERHGTSVRQLVQANGLRSAEMIREGQRLVIPGAVAAGRRSAPAVAVARPKAGRTVQVTPAVTRVARSFLWPARGVLTSRFGRRWRRHHDGIDIAAPRGSQIYAARSGRVIFAGWYYGYGRAVIIDHGGGMTTLYGHASALLVGNGKVVNAGELIARVGCTGHCTGSHVHFEIRINGRAVNPLRYL